MIAKWIINSNGGGISVWKIKGKSPQLGFLAPTRFRLHTDCSLFVSGLRNTTTKGYSQAAGNNIFGNNKHIYGSCCRGWLMEISGWCCLSDSVECFHFATIFTEIMLIYCLQCKFRCECSSVSHWRASSSSLPHRTGTSSAAAAARGVWLGGCCLLISEYLFAR